MSIIDLELKVKEELTRITNDRAKMYYKTLIDEDYNPELDRRMASLTKLLGNINVSSAPLDVLYRTAKELGVDAEYAVTEVTVASKDGAKRIESAAVKKLRAKITPKTTTTNLNVKISFGSYYEYNHASSNYELNKDILEGHIYKETTGKVTKYYVGVGAGVGKVKLYFRNMESTEFEIMVKGVARFTVKGDNIDILLEYAAKEAENAIKAPAQAPALKPAPALKAPAQAPTLKPTPALKAPAQAPALKAPAPTLKPAPAQAPTLKPAPALKAPLTLKAPATVKQKSYKFRSDKYKKEFGLTTFTNVKYTDNNEISDAYNELIDIAVLTTWLKGYYIQKEAVIKPADEMPMTINGFASIAGILANLDPKKVTDKHKQFIGMINKYQPDPIMTDIKLQTILGYIT
jgi:hypothetical protein